MLGTHALLLLLNLSFATEDRPTDYSFLNGGADLAPEDGIWIKDSGLGGDWSDCIHALRIASQQGQVLRIVACTNGQTQVETQSIVDVGTTTESGWTTNPSPYASTLSLAKSCKNNPSVFDSGDFYVFDRSLSGSGPERSLFVTTNVGSEKEIFRSGATYPDLGKTKGCDLIVHRAQQDSQKENRLLQTAAVACQATLDNAGCFLSEGLFVDLSGE